MKKNTKVLKVLTVMGGSKLGGILSYSFGSRE